MTVSTFNYTTGPSTMPDVGTLSYNGCVFSPLYETSVSGNCVKDNAHRTVMYMEYTITADGYATLPDGESSVAGTVATLRLLLTQQAGALIYQGRGCDLIVNVGGAVLLAPGNAKAQDVAWGPVPELLEFQPLGGGLSAKVKWRVTVRIPEIVPGGPGSIGDTQIGGGGVGGGGGGPVGGPVRGIELRRVKGGPGGLIRVLAAGIARLPLLQFNYETTATYGEDGYSTLSIRGTAEIPQTRSPDQKTRTVKYTADDVRSEIDRRVLVGIDLAQYRMTRRVFNVSRDKRVLEWDIELEEKPYMDLPGDCTVAHGTYNVRPAHSGVGLVSWLCTLRATYTVRADRPRRVAWLAFLALLRLRMSYSLWSFIPRLSSGNGGANPPRSSQPNVLKIAASFWTPGVKWWDDTLKKETPAIMPPTATATGPGKNAWLIDFSFDEGLYLDSKVTSFSATWRLVTTMSHILLSSGLWRKLPEQDNLGNNLWASSMTTGPSVILSQSWIPNRLDPKFDTIVDLGGG